MSSIKKFRILKFKSKPILTVKGIVKSINKRMILRKIDFEINKGEIFGLLGPNGAGKSVTFNVLLGIMKADEGNVFVEGTKITNYTHKDGMEQPVIHWTPSIAVCGMDFYDGKVFNNWKNNLLITSLKFENLYRLEIRNKKVIKQELILSVGSRVRDVETGPDGFIYLAIENPGRIIRLRPHKK